MHTYTRVSYTTQRNSLASGPSVSFSHYISWRYISHFVVSFFSWPSASILLLTSPTLDCLFPECLAHVQFLAFVLVWNVHFFFSFPAQFLSFLQIPVICFPVLFCHSTLHIFVFNGSHHFFKKITDKWCLFLQPSSLRKVSFLFLCYQHLLQCLVSS